MRRSALILVSCLLTAGCIRPRYERPEVAVPPAYRGAAPTSPAAGTLADLKWQDLIHDEQLGALVREALANNYDVKIAAARVLEARAQARVARSQQSPSIEGRAGYTSLRMAQDGSSSLPYGYPNERGYSQIESVLSWELDLWGRLRNTTAAARADLLASEEARHAVMAALGGQVAQTYFLLRDLDLEKEIIEQSLKSRQESLELVRLRVENGYSSEIDLHQAEVLVKTARTTRTDLERQIEQAENRISFLLGRSPGPVTRGRPLLEQDLTSKPEPGLPSTLLARRPDIRQAEKQLVSSQAQVAVARAAFFPAISLTSTAGFESASLQNLLVPGNSTWLFNPVKNLPLFNAGRIRAGVRGAEARREQALLNYQKIVMQAFHEVADALVACRKTGELRSEQEGLVESLRAASELADLRYRGGVASYLEYLDSEREFLDAKLRLVQVRREELASVVNLYLGLGGGW